MDIAALSMVMSQSRVQESAGISVMKVAMDAGYYGGKATANAAVSRGN